MGPPGTRPAPDAVINPFGQDTAGVTITIHSVFPAIRPSGGALADIVDAMAGVPQPRAQAAAVTAFARFTSAHAFAVNLVAVAALAAFGAAFCWGNPRMLRVAVPAADFRLVTQTGQPVSLATLRGKVTLLTFLDPLCTASARSPRAPRSQPCCPRPPVGL